MKWINELNGNGVEIMINLKRIIQICVFIFLVLPIILMMYLTSLFGMSFEFKQWVSACGLFILGVLSPMIVNGL